MENKQKKRDSVVFGSIFVLAAALVVFIGIDAGHLFNITNSLDDPDAGSVSVEKGYIGRAISLLETGTFNYGKEGEYIGGGQRGPVYVLLLALGFLVIGKYVGVVYGLNFLLFLLSVGGLWMIARKFFTGWLYYLPPLFLALYAGTASRVWSARNEALILFLAVFFLFAFLKYRDTRKTIWLFITAIVFSFWVLEKPILLYFLPVLVILFIFLGRPYVQTRRLVMHMGLFVFAVILVIGSWSLRNYSVLGIWQLGSGGHVLLIRSTQVDFSKPEIISLALSYAVGDFIGSRMYAGYPLDTKPKGWDPAVLDRWARPGWVLEDYDGEMLTRLELDRKMYKEAISKIRERPLKFTLLSFVNFLRLNSPMNHKGQEIIRLFMGEHEGIRVWQKTFIILGVRGIWIIFLLVTLFAAIKHLKDWRVWGVVFFIILYINGTYSFLTHAEARYLVSILPFYFLFFTEGLRLIFWRWRAVNPRHQES